MTSFYLQADILYRYVRAHADANRIPLVHNWLMIIDFHI